MNDMYNRIELLCKAHGINITQMCRNAEIARGNLTDLKMGRTTALSTKTLQKISLYFDVPLEYLIGAEPQATTPAAQMDLQLFSEKKEPAGQVADELNAAGYYELNSENRAVIDSLIAKLLKSQSDE